MEINDDTEFPIGGFVVHKGMSEDAVGIIVEKEKTEEGDTEWGKYYYGVKWFKFKSGYPPAEGPWSLPDFKQNAIKYLGTNPKTVEVLYGYKEI